MKQNLDTLKGEILEQLAAQGFTVFHGYCRLGDGQNAMCWDTARYPDFRQYLDTARQAGVKLVTFYHREFERDAVEDAIDRLGDCEMPSDERKMFDLRLEELRRYAGFTCVLELSFACQGQVHTYSLQAPWYEDFLALSDDIDIYLPAGEEGEGEDEGPIGGYFSRN